MKERPIIFSAPMVRAILDGRKTQTRQVVKPQPPHSCRYVMNGAASHALCFGPNDECVPPTGTSIDHRLPCPYGVPGDRLWVRETWNTLPLRHVFYREGGEMHKDWKWRSPIHMPRWASRITLEITAVRVERLNEISAKDAVREGVGLPDECDHEIECSDPRNGATWTDLESNAAGGCPWSSCHCARDCFRELWDRINGKRHPWSSNPWVWVLEFKRLETET